MPILSEQFGWELINPFTGSMAEYLGGSESSVTSTEDITHNIWRKQLNNLILEYCVKNILVNATQYINYINEIKQPMNIMENPKDTSIQKSLMPKHFF